MPYLTHKGKPTSKGQRLDYEDNIKQGSSQPINGEGSPALYINAKALKNLPASSISIQADPYTAALPSSQPFPFVNKLNRYTGGQYSGDRNLDGGSALQYAISNRTNFLKVVDTIAMKLKFNYQYIDASAARNPKVGKGIIDQMRKVIAETISLLDASTFTNLAIHSYVVETDMPMGSAAGKEVNKESGVYRYTEATDVIYAALMHYQTVLQDILCAFNQHNSFRTKMGTMIRMEYQRNIPALNNLFGLFKKKSYLALPNSVAMDISGEYVDVSWMKQVNTQLLTPSRRANSLNEPLLELFGSFNLPSTFKLIVLDSDGNDAATVYDYSSQKFTYKGVTRDLNRIVERLAALFTAQDTLTWARNSNYSSNVGEDRFNEVNSLWSAISNFMNYFKIAFNDVRTVIDVLSRVNTVSWTKGFKPMIIASTDVPEITRNLVVDNIMQVALTGPTNIKFNNTTKYWESWTLWNMYTGIPEYDAFSGGSFLTFSLKDIEADDDNELLYIPIGFTKPFDHETGEPQKPFYATTRDGVQFNFESAEIQLFNDKATARLIALPSQESYVAYIPSVTGSDVITKAATPMHLSMLIRTLSVLGGYCRISNTVYAESDLLVVYDIQIPNINNEMIAYSRTNGPFQGSRSPVQFGFLGTRTDSGKYDNNKG